MDANLMEQAQELATSIAGQASTIGELNDVLKVLTKSVIEQMLGSELNVHLQEERAAVATTSDSGDSSAAPRSRNRRNGTTPKSVQCDQEPIELDSPRDRAGTFEPPLMPKHQQRLEGI